MNPIEEFEDLISDSRARHMANVGAENWVGRELSEEESVLLLKGLNAGLISFDNEKGKIDLVGFSPSHRGELKSYQLFSNWKTNAYWVWQEMFIQIGFGIELVLNWGWPKQLVAFESCGFDIVAFRGDRPEIMAEAKVTPTDLDEQMRVFLNGAVDGSSTDVNRYRDLINFQPKMYAAVALSTRRYFDLVIKHDSELEFRARKKPLSYSTK